MIMSKLRFLWIPIIAFFAFFFYFIIYTNLPINDGEQLFFSNVLSGLMGAVVVALVTASIFIFQQKIEADEQKERLMYEKKLVLYQKVSKELSEALADGELSIGEIQTLRKFEYELILIAKKPVAEAFLSLIQKGEEFDQEKSGELGTYLKTSIMEFLTEARRDLDVLSHASDTEEMQNWLGNEDTQDTLTKTKRRFTEQQKIKILKEWRTAKVKQDILKMYKVYDSQVRNWDKGYP